MSDLDVESLLSHYGIPGMKWGVRKDRIKSSEHYNKDLVKRKTFTVLLRSQVVAL